MQYSLVAVLALAALADASVLKSLSQRSLAAAQAPDPTCKNGVRGLYVDGTSDAEQATNALLSPAQKAAAPQKVACCAGYCGECNDYLDPSMVGEGRHLMKVGDKIVAKYPPYRGKSDDAWFAGTVTTISSTTCSIAYEDGDSSSDVRFDEVLYAPSRDAKWGKGALRGNNKKPEGAKQVSMPRKCENVRGQASKDACCASNVINKQCGIEAIILGTATVNPANNCLKLCSESHAPCIMDDPKAYNLVAPSRNAADNCSTAVETWRQQAKAALGTR